jgi:hypothetical protein
MTTVGTFSEGESLTRLSTVAVERKRFLLALAATTVSPMLLMPVLAHFHPAASGIAGLRNLLIFFGGTGHVALTAYFYTDRDLHPLFREHKGRYLVAPVLLTLGTGIAYAALSPTVAAHILLAYFAWQTYHYMRQNYGILAFVGLATESGPPLFLERVILNVGVFSGILGLVRLMGLEVSTVLDGYEGLLYETGCYAYLFVPALVALALLSSKRLRQSQTRVAFLILFALFYLPTYLFEDLGSAVSSYAFAHGFQYFVFMYYVGRKDGGERTTRRMLTLLAFCCSFGYLLLLMSRKEVVGNLLFGSYLGLVMAHFVVDAGVWRMREAFQRSYLSRPFGFVLGHRS